MAKTKAEKITSIEEEIRQLENRRRQLVQEQKAQERKDRTKRLCRRMGLFESLVPDSIPLTEEQFKTFLEKTVMSDVCKINLDKRNHCQGVRLCPCSGWVNGFLKKAAPWQQLEHVKKIRLPYYGGDEMSRVFTEEQVNEAIACDVRYYMELWKKGLYSRSVDLRYAASHSVAGLLMLRQHMGLATADEVSEALEDFNTFKETAIYEFIVEVSDE